MKEIILKAPKGFEFVSNKRQVIHYEQWYAVLLEDGTVSAIQHLLYECTDGMHYRLRKVVDTKVREAFGTIKQAMKDDNPSKPGSYAHSWHCNVAMMCADAIQEGCPELASHDAHRIGNDAATRFMKLCFDVDTKA